MKYIDILYHKPTPDEDVNDPSCLKHIGTVEVSNARYAMTTEGRIYFNIETAEPYWMERLNRQHEGIGEDHLGLILSTSPEIWKGDIFDIYTIVDPELYTYFDMNYQGGLGHVILYWKLQSRTYLKEAQPLADITHRPDGCPMCGSHLDYSDMGEAYCTNQNCGVYKFRDTSRFLNHACGIYGFNKVLNQLVRAGLVYSPVDLYYEHVVEKSYEVFGKSSRILYTFWDAILHSLGKVELANYIKCLPLRHSFACVQHRGDIKPNGRFFCPTTINKDFQRDPLRFVQLIQNSFDLFYLSEDEKIWMEKSSSTLNRYMSFPVFYDIAELLVQPETEWSNYSDTIKDLMNLGVFSCKM